MITTLGGIEAPHNVQVGRDGQTVYAVSGSNTMVAIDAVTYGVRAIAPTGGGPAHVIETNDKIYVTNSADGTVAVYRAGELQPIGQITVGGMPHGLRPSADGSIVVIANTMEAALDVIDPATDTVLGSVPVGANPAQVAVTADGRFAYAPITDPSAVVKVDLDAYTVVAAAPVPSDPVQVYLTPDEATVISADQGTRDEPGSTASSIDTATMTVRSTATTGSGPHGVVVDTAGTRAWATASATHRDMTVPPQPDARSKWQRGEEDCRCAALLACLAVAIGCVDAVTRRPRGRSGHRAGSAHTGQDPARRGGCAVPGNATGLRQRLAPIRELVLAPRAPTIACRTGCGRRVSRRRRGYRLSSAMRMGPV